MTEGFAAAVQPVSAQTIHTDSAGLDAGPIRMQAKDTEIDAYRAMPAGGGRFPIVLVVQEIFGVHEHIRDVCRRLAKVGYYAIAPELYQRQADVSSMTDIQEILSKVVSRVPDSQVMSDLDDAVEYAVHSGQGDLNRLAVTGFCWGGRITWLYAAHNRLLKAGVAWYGRLVGQASQNQPKHAVDIASKLRAPVLGLYGGKDDGIPLLTVERMRSALSAGKKSEIVVYPEGRHGFFADYRPNYGKAEAEDGWKRMLAWFREHGAG